MVGMNPMVSAQQFLQNILSNKSMIEKNPMAQNVVNMLNNGDSKGLEQMYRNLCKERGINADEAYRNAVNKLGIK